jgi:hypothetical protein
VSNAVSAPGLRFIAINAMAEDLGGKCSRTVKRLAQTDPDFPKLFTIGNQLHAAVPAWEDYKVILMNRGTQVRPLAGGMKVGRSPGRPRKTAVPA